MLCLRQEVGRYKDRVGGFIGQHFYFRRACGHVNGYVAQAHQLLGSGNVLVAGAEYLVHFRYAFCSVCHSGNGLYSSGLVDFAHSCHTCGKEYGGVYFPVFSRGTAQNDFFASGQFSGNSEHEYGRE
ncbi:hypothetical protein SDC9_194435 [bioreactor metagenome]|uniref:Uncharacterized protein n=1 Tax=bioreactor metagenome TaxID=1076179 RepID=A0A645I7G2_9ZZZZ